MINKKSNKNPWHQFVTRLKLKQSGEDVEYMQNVLQMDRIEKKVSEVSDHVPLKFSSETNYKKRWERLFFEEAKAQILRSNESQGSKPQIIQFVQIVEQSIEYKVFSFAKVQKGESAFMKCCVVLLSPGPPPVNKAQEYPHLVGYIEEGNESSIVVRVHLPDSMKTIDEQKWNLFTTTKKWYAQLFCSVVSLQRQFLALSRFQSINMKLKEVILNPSEHNNELDKKFRIPSDLDKKLKQVYNQSQYKAINQCLKQTGITLIQGPPGTGKTKTVLGTLSVLLHSFYKNDDQIEQPLILNWKKSATIRKQSKKIEPWMQSSFADWRDEPFIDDVQDFLNLTKFYKKCNETDKQIALKNKDEVEELPGKILICGPSNASVDEIIRKLIKQKLYVSDGNTFSPNFVRIGDNYDKELKKYSLQNLAQAMATKEKVSDLGQCRQKILKSYRIVFGTLSSAGNQIIQNSKIKFDTVIIDQAGQSVQVSNLIPLVHGCERLILIGDPNQLPATVFNRRSIQNGYDQSLFERLMKCGYPVSVLKTQYRMQPDISDIIGKHFYGQKLLNYSEMMIEEPKNFKNSFVMFHLEDSGEQFYKKSYLNKRESVAIKSFITYVSKQYSEIGILSPYSRQVEYLESLNFPKKCEIKTIDSFQGRQKEVIVLSTVRSRYIEKNNKLEQNYRKTIGFVSDFRRINVGLSRAKNLCVIFGDLKRLSMNEKWGQIVKDGIEKGEVFEYKASKSYWSEMKSKSEKHLMKQF